MVTVPRAVRLAGVGAAVAAAALSACGKSGASTTNPSTAPTRAATRPSSTARLRILSPHNNQVVTGSTVSVKVSLQGARIVPGTSLHVRPDEGHLHAYLDGRIVAMNYSLDGTIPNVTPGLHVLRIEFVASDHAPFDPRVFREITFQVRP